MTPFSSLKTTTSSFTDSPGVFSAPITETVHFSKRALRSEGETESVMEDASKRKRELEAAVLDKVGEVISAIKNAKRVDQVICALHSLAVLLFPLDYPSLLAGHS
jgi:hypothetical protein